MQDHDMSSDDNFKWTGAGRWLAFVSAATLIILAIPSMFTHDTEAAAGWDTFLGFLLFGAVASGNEHAPTVAMVIAALMVIRIFAAISVSAPPIAIGLGFVLLVITGAAAWDLRRQGIARAKMK